MLVVPALMHMLGRFNGWMPRRLGRRLPEPHIEGHPEQHLGSRTTPVLESATA
jgi:RND superfamily putative drug exporter